MSSGHTDVLGDVILCCAIGNVLGLGITAVVLRVSARAFSGNVTHTNHYLSHNQGESGRLLTCSRDTSGGDGRVGYKSHVRHYSSQIVDSRGYGERHGSRSKEINLLSFLNVGESFDGVGRS